MTAESREALVALRRRRQDVPGLRVDAMPRQVSAGIGAGYVLSVSRVDADDDHLARLPQQWKRIGESAFRLAGPVPGEHDGTGGHVERTGVRPHQNGSARTEHDTVRQSGGGPVMRAGLADDGDVGMAGASGGRRPPGRPA